MFWLISFDLFATKKQGAVVMSSPWGCSVQAGFRGLFDMGRRDGPVDGGS